MREIKFRAWDGQNMRYEFFIQSKIGLAVVEMYDGIEFRSGWKVMQSTGLKDRNGVDIYEGDVVEVLDGGYHTEIKWSEKFHGWLPWVGNQEGYDSFDDLPVLVAGNIYEDQDLINLD